jgi:fibronectin-binding autotransporter adhesin
MPKRLRNRRRPNLEFEPLENRQLLAVRIWDGGGGDNLWSTAANWQNDTAPQANDDLEFPTNGVRYSPVNDFANTTFGSITLDDSGYSITGNALSLTGNIVTTYAASNSTYSIDTNLVGSEGVNVAGGGSLVLSGVLSGSGSLIKDGAGTLTLSGANTYDGGTTVHTGKLILASRQGLGSGSATVGDGTSSASLTLNIAGTGTIANTFVFNTTNANGLVGGSGTNTLGGGITLNQNLSVNVSYSQIKLAGIVDDGGQGKGFIKEGSGPLWFTGSSDNTFTGTTVVDEGSLLLNASAVAIPGNVNIGGTGQYPIVQERRGNQLADTSVVTLINPAATFDLYSNSDTIGSLIFNGGQVWTGSGTLTLSTGGVTTNASSSTAMITGNLDLGGSGRAFTIADGSAANDLSISAVISDGGITQTGAGTMVLSGANTFDGTVHVLSGTLVVQNASALGSTVGETAIDAGAVLAFDTSGTIGNTIDLGSSGNGATVEQISGDIVLTGPVTIAGDNLFNITGGSLTISGSIAGEGNLIKSGADSLSLSGTNTYVGTTQINTGILNANSAGALSTSVVTIADGASLGIGGGSTITPTFINVSGTGVGGNGAIQSVDGANSYAGALNMLGDTTIGANDSSLALSGVIGELGGSFSLTKVGSGTLSLSGANEYSNGTTVAAGILAVSNDHAFGTGNVLNNAEIDIANNLSLANNFTLNSSGTAFENLGLNTINGTITLLATATIDTPGFSNLYLNGIVSGNGFGLIKNGTGTLGLGKANTYSGGTSVNAGYLQVFDTSATGTSGIVSVAGGATLVQSVGTFTLPSGGLSLADGSTFLVPLPSFDTLNGSIALTGTATFSIASGASLTIPGAIRGGNSAGLIKASGGALVLSHANTYSGTTTILAGTLVANDLQALGSTDGGTVVSDGATLLFHLDGGTVAEPITLGSNGASATLWSDTGNLVLSGNITVLATGNIVTDGESLELSGVIDDAHAGYGLVKSGTGTIFKLSGANTFDGNVHLVAGEIEALNPSALGSTVGYTAVDGGTAILFDFHGGTLAEALHLGSSGNGAYLRNLSGDTTLSGPITLEGTNQVFNGVEPLTFSGVLSGDGGINLVGNALVYLTGTNTYLGTTLVSSGTLIAASDGALSTSAVTISDGATLAIQGGHTITPASISVGGTGSGSGSGGAIQSLDGVNAYAGPITLTGDTNITVNSDRLTLSGAIGGGSYVASIAGAGTLDLSGTNSLVGLSVQQGTTLINGTSPLSINGAEVASGATLGGSGTIGNLLVDMGATVAPGNSPGILNTGNVSLPSGSIYAVQINGTTVGTQYDQLNVTGTVNLGGATLSLAVGTIPVNGDRFTIIKNDGTDAVTGTFAGLPEGAIFSSQGQLFKISYVGGTGNDVVLTSNALGVQPDTLATPTLGRFYTEQLTAIGGSGTGYGFAATGLPAGLSMSPNGLITGTPTSTAMATALVTITDSTGAMIVKTYVVTPINAATTASLSTSTSTSHYGESVILTATFTTTANNGAAMTGIVQFFDGNTYLGEVPITSTTGGSVPAPLITGSSGAVRLLVNTVSGQAQFASNSLSVGDHNIRAVYSGDANYVATTSRFPASVQVDPATTATTLAATPSPSGTTLMATVVVTSPGNPPIVGNVDFFDGTTRLATVPVVNGVAVYNAVGLLPGMHNFNAVFSGGATSSASGSTVPISTAGPRVIGLSRHGFHWQKTTLVLNFDSPLDPARAENVANYRIVDSAGRGIAVTTAVYDPTSLTVTLSLAKPLSVYRVYKLTVVGTEPNGLAGVTGIAFDGSGMVQPGTNFTTKITWKTLAVPGTPPAMTFHNGQTTSFHGSMMRYLNAITRATRALAHHTLKPMVHHKVGR